MNIGLRGIDAIGHGPAERLDLPRLLVADCSEPAGIFEFRHLRAFGFPRGPRFGLPVQRFAGRFGRRVGAMRFQ